MAARQKCAGKMTYHSFISLIPSFKISYMYIWTLTASVDLFQSFQIDVSSMNMFFQLNDFSLSLAHTYRISSYGFLRIGNKLKAFKLYFNIFASPFFSTFPFHAMCLISDITVEARKWFTSLYDQNKYMRVYTSVDEMYSMPKHIE